MVAAFDGGAVTSDAGGLLLRRDRSGDRADRAGSPACFDDDREPDAGRAHGAGAGRRSGSFGIALGYEDVIDHDELRHDPVLATARRQARRRSARTARRWPARARSTGWSTRRCGRTTAITRSATTRRRSNGCSSICSSRRTDGRPKQIILDLDATDDPLHGQQEGRFFHGYYDCYCYLPLYVFCGRHLLAAKLRPLEHRRLGRRGGGGGAHRRPDPRSAGRGCGSCCAPTRALPATS